MNGHDEVAALSLTALASAIRAKRISSVEATKACIARIENAQPLLNCFIAIEADAALERARQSDEDLSRGKIRGALHGVPLAHKDLFYRENKISTCGSKIHRGIVADHTATVIGRLEAAGALQLGTLNMAEFALGPTGHNEHYGHCRNPWNLEHISGGSSSGSGAAVAARLAYGALGSDTGGSIRIPAACCGVVGLKSTQTRVSRHGVMPLSFSLDCPGPLARTVHDCARLFSVIVGPDDNDPTTAVEPATDFEAALGANLKGLRIGVCIDAVEDDTMSDIRHTHEAALEVYRSLGAEITKVRMPDANHFGALANVIQKCESATVHGQWMRTRSNDYSEQVRSRIEAGLFLPAVRYIEALSLRGLFLREFVKQVFETVDALYLPTLPIPVPTISETDVKTGNAIPTMVATMTGLTRWVNYLGLPALSVPCGFDCRGLPVGFQLIGRPFSEARLFNLGHQYQKATDWHERAPNFIS